MVGLLIDGEILPLPLLPRPSLEEYDFELPWSANGMCRGPDHF
jgi:hypothetical protein